MNNTGRPNPRPGSLTPIGGLYAFFSGTLTTHITPRAELSK
jgi:hypothetical protein